ncbi:mandelate racemase/muconate lactonizing enzyme family protein [Nordella sp. HKS 07]|uniref:mandelate racemase/muconate lactonizing enzyme family protein n=1 Tax=Nordella sp. HKS 07 TaxID=2712222 RepID=UPI0013E14951|nr:mandelate racemase/muconate lactonizing enzyme family protein [Nordella sp. HKS 07]QIG48467.1 mandelate racemase/muconate lactonizing enzyme family protein [Nordella sp. HKS 07]
MKEHKIERAEVFVVGPDVERYTWAEGMTGQYMANIILHLTAASGLQGFAGAAMITPHCFDRAVGETLRHVLPDVIGRHFGEREILWHQMRNLGTPMVPQAHSLIDIALWDMAARHARLPLHQFLGGARDKILSYASTPLLADDQAYIDYVGERHAEGFKAVKFHCWCVPERDLPMCEAVKTHFEGKDLALMLDVEQRYDLNGALRAARHLSELDFRWFEAPLVDTDIEGYREIRRQSTVPVIAAGNTWTDLQMLTQAAKLGAWSALRVDATICGGITPLRKIMGLAEAMGMDVEIQCWGYTLTQAANLHVMLAYRNCTYFEQPVPYPAFEYGSHDVIRTDKQGYVHAPKGEGLGIGIDWKAVEKAAILQFEVR